MNILKKILITLVIFVIGFLVGRLTDLPGSLLLGSSAPDTEINETTGTPSTKANVPGAVTVPASSLTDGQIKMLEALGVDTANLTITPAMVTCAEEKVGAARLAEIQSGATPSLTEGYSLLRCYSN